MMDEARRRLVEELFCGAADLPPDELSDFLAGRCGDDLELRAEVESLLAHDSAATRDFQPESVIHADQLLEELEPGARADAVGTLACGATPKADGPSEIPERIGAYRILEVLGEGGMGVVYRAEQDSPRRTVALKVIRPDYISRQTLRRFEYEASVLGRLQHPGIAQIYEAGAARMSGSKTVRAYFAMELIRGEPLTEYVHSRAAGISERLELIAKVCDAVEHAHRNGVIHRDLKPGNILVGDNGEPKILDFGVARAIDSDAQMTTMQTDVGQLIGTVPYMSPEQVAGDPRHIDTRSDVYALGVNLFELLAGRLPHDLSRASLIEAARIIQDDPPTQLSSVNRVLRGDVETIVSKALEKDKRRRYQAAAELAADIRRYLRDEPILARPLSAVYQLRKFAKRNKTLVVSTAAVFVALAAGLIVSTTQYFATERARAAEEIARGAAETARDVAERAGRAEADQRRIAEANAERAQREANKASSVNRFLRDMLASVKPSNALGGDFSVRQVLDAAAGRIERRAAKMDPEVQAEVRSTVGLTYLRLGLYDAAEPHLTAALELRQRVFDGIHRDVAQAMTNLAELRRAQGQLETADELMRGALRVLRALDGDYHGPIAAAMHNLAALQKTLDRPDEAERLYREVLAMHRESSESAPAELASTLKALGTLLQEQGRVDEAEALLREALELRRQVLPRGHPELATGLSNLGYLLAMREQFDEAELLLDEALTIQRRTLPAGHPALAASLAMLGAARLEAGRAAEAEPPLREALAIRKQALPADHWLIDNTTSLLGACIAEQGGFEQAEPLLLESCRALEAGAGAPAQRRREAFERVIRLYELSGKDQSAAEWRERLATTFGPESEKAVNGAGG